MGDTMTDGYLIRLFVRAAPFRLKKAIACSRSYSAPFFFERSQLRISNQVPIPEPIVGEYSPPSMKPIIDTRINSAPATALGRTSLRIGFNDISDHCPLE